MSDRIVSRCFQHLLWCLGFALYCAATHVFADMPDTGLKLQAYPYARTVFTSESKEDDYMLALGSYRKIDGLWGVDREQHLSGKLVTVTLELSQGHSALDGFTFYTRQLQQLHSREIYSCEARECGPSNSWANNYFKIIQLYGLDQYQHYAVYEVVNDQQPPFYVSIYSVLRGTKRAYVQVNILHSDKVSHEGIASAPETLSRLLVSRGYYVFPELFSQAKATQSDGVLDIRKTHLDALVTLLDKQKNLHIALVGHNYGPGDLAQQQSASLVYAESLKAALVKAGIAEKRIAAYGLGSLAPAGRKEQAPRVEVVRVPN